MLTLSSRHSQFPVILGRPKVPGWSIYREEGAEILWGVTVVKNFVDGCEEFEDNALSDCKPVWMLESGRNMLISPSPSQEAGCIVLYQLKALYGLD